jgi:hypothetical protein
MSIELMRALHKIKEGNMARKAKMNLDPAVGIHPLYEEKHYLRFWRDMKNADLEPYDYRGRYFWHGPAVNVGDLQDALSHTKVPCQWDSMGMGWVVYPRG